MTNLSEKIKYAEEHIPRLVKNGQLTEALLLLEGIDLRLSVNLAAWKAFLCIASGPDPYYLDEDDGYPD